MCIVRAALDENFSLFGYPSVSANDFQLEGSNISSSSELFVALCTSWVKQYCANRIEANQPRAHSSNRVRWKSKGRTSKNQWEWKTQANTEMWRKKLHQTCCVRCASNKSHAREHLIKCKHNSKEGRERCYPKYWQHFQFGPNAPYRLQLKPRNIHHSSMTFWWIFSGWLTWICCLFGPLVMVAFITPPITPQWPLPFPSHAGKMQRLTFD